MGREIDEIDRLIKGLEYEGVEGRVGGAIFNHAIANESGGGCFCKGHLGGGHFLIGGSGCQRHPMGGLSENVRMIGACRQRLHPLLTNSARSGMGMAGGDHQGVRRDGDLSGNLRIDGLAHFVGDGEQIVRDDNDRLIAVTNGQGPCINPIVNAGCAPSFTVPITGKRCADGRRNIDARRPGQEGKGHPLKGRDVGQGRFCRKISPLIFKGSGINRKASSK